MSVCLPAYLPVCLSACLSACLSVCLHVALFVGCLYVCLSLSVCLSALKAKASPTCYHAAWQGPTWQQAVQWLGEVDAQAGSQLSLVAKHDTYGISFAWPASSPEVPTGQVTDQGENTNCASSMARPAARKDGSRGACAGESSSKGSNPFDSAGRTVDELGTSDRLAHLPNSSGNTNQGSREPPAGRDSSNVESQQGDAPLPTLGTKQASGVPFMVCCLLSKS